MASEEMSFENVDDDGQRTTDALLYYKLTCTISLRLRWVNKRRNEDTEHEKTLKH